MNRLVQFAMVAAASLLAASPARPAERRATQDVLQYVNSSFDGARSSQRIEVTGSPPNQAIVLNSTSKMDGKHFVYRAALRDFDPSQVRVIDGLFGKSVLAVCRRAVSCVTSFDGRTGKPIIRFSYLEMGPLRSGADSPIEVAKGIRELIEAKRAP